MIYESDAGKTSNSPPNTWVNSRCNSNHDVDIKPYSNLSQADAKYFFNFTKGGVANEVR